MTKQNRGPKTRAGKAAISRNAAKHGITSQYPVVPGVERHEDWIAHRDGIIESLAPEGYLEQDLAGQIAFLRWRLRRITRHETAVITQSVSSVELDRGIADRYYYGEERFLANLEGDAHDIPVPTEEEFAIQRERRMIPDLGTINNIMRYEASLHRLWLQTYHELEAIQSRRLGQPVGLHRLDVTSGPAQLGESPRALLSGL